MALDDGRVGATVRSLRTRFLAQRSTETVPMSFHTVERCPAGFIDERRVQVIPGGTSPTNMPGAAAGGCLRGMAGAALFGTERAAASRAGAEDAQR